LRSPLPTGILALVEDPHGVDPTPDEGIAAGKPDFRPARGRSFLPEVTGIEFSHSRRGYDREQVDRYVERVSRIIVELEALRSPDAVIERALADVGEETSAILRRARTAAEEIETDASAHAQRLTDAAEAQGRQIAEQAEGHGEQIRAEAEKVLADARTRAGELTAEAAEDARRLRAEADDYEDRVAAHVEQLAHERQRLIEDLRKLADSFHRTADRAIEEAPGRQPSHEAVGDRSGAPEPRPV
jgi:DivIVA domain-containing protein